jgi:DHA1 family multidrug resistance protein-like MFS transporter
MSNRINKALSVLIYTGGTIYLTAAMSGPFYAIYVGNVGGDIEVAGMAVALLFFVRGLASIIIAKFENKFKETEFFLIAGGLLRSLGFAGYIFAREPIHLGYISFILGIADAIIYPAADALFSRHVKKGQDVAQWGWWEVMESWGTALGALLGGFIASIFGFNAVFFSMALISTINALVILILPRKIL